MKIVVNLYVLHHVSKIYHTEIDFKLHALKFRQEGTQTVLVQGVEGNDGDDNL